MLGLVLARNLTLTRRFKDEYYHQQYLKPKGSPSCESAFEIEFPYYNILHRY